MTNQEKEKLRSEIIAFMDTKFNEIETREPTKLSLLEWMRLCRLNRVNKLIKLGNIVARIDERGVLKMDSIKTQYAAALGDFSSCDINEYRLTGLWEEVL